MKAKIYAIIVAAGKGHRMQNARPKQYIELDGIPILSRTLGIFNRCDLIDQIIVVVPKDDIDFCRTEILPGAELVKEVDIISGGAQRQDSVYRGLQAIKADGGIVCIHDGVRPFVRPEHLVACINGARDHRACILGIPAFDTVKQANANDEIVQTLKRDGLWLAQTPQAFELKLIKKAHETAQQEALMGTDDAALVERLGEAVKIIPGSRSNIKITDPEDLKLASALLQLGASDH